MREWMPIKALRALPEGILLDTPPLAENAALNLLAPAGSAEEWPEEVIDMFCLMVFGNNSQVKLDILGETEILKYDVDLMVTSKWIRGCGTTSINDYLLFTSKASAKFFPE